MKGKKKEKFGPIFGPHPCSESSEDHNLQLVPKVLFFSLQEEGRKHFYVSGVFGLCFFSGVQVAIEVACSGGKSCWFQ